MAYDVAPRRKPLENTATRTSWRSSPASHCAPPYTRQTARGDGVLGRLPPNPADGASPATATPYRRHPMPLAWLPLRLAPSAWPDHVSHERLATSDRQDRYRASHSRTSSLTPQ